MGISNRGSSQAPLYVCPVCHTKNHTWLKYCNQCGTWLIETDAPTNPKEARRIRHNRPLNPGWLILGVGALLLAVYVLGRVVPSVSP